MVDEQALIQTIHANPTDDVPRLVYADWLEERGDLRGEFLRIQTALMRMPRKDRQHAGFMKRLKELRSSIDPESLAWFNTLRYRTAFAALARPLTPSNGVPEKRVAQAEHRLGVRLPRALRDYYLLAGRCDRLNQANDRLLPPEDWELASGKIAFLVENQGVALAGVRADDPAGDDPPVFWGYLDEDDRPDWHRHQGRCSDFLVINLYQQAVLGGMKYRGQANIDAEDLAQIQTTWPFIGEGYVDAFGKDGQAVCVQGPELYVGGRTRKDFNAIVAAFSQMGVSIEPS
jgi:uncharacterized protein (TIGR02996 family)